MPLVGIDFYRVRVNDVVLKNNTPYLVTSKKKKLVRVEELRDDPKARWFSADNFDRKQFQKLTTE